MNNSIQEEYCLPCNPNESNSIKEEDNRKYKISGCSINNIDLGLCCLNTTLRSQKPSIFASRTCRLNTAEKKGKPYLKELITKNLQDVLKILDNCFKNGIKAYRLSSQMFPHASNIKYGRYRKHGPRYGLKFAWPLLTKIGKKAQTYGIRLSFHPGQWNQIGAESDSVFEKTIVDLKYHCRILDLIEKNTNPGKNKGIICIHGGGVYKNKEKTIQRWKTNFMKLPKRLRKRLALENCERNYSSIDCLELAEELNIPHIFDIHHYNCYSLINPDYEQNIKSLLPRIIKTWTKRGLKPYFHISEQGSGRIGHHSDYIENIPEYMFNLKITITLDVEAKKKELAIYQLIQIYKNK
jgi:UV DNA damage endonuclease